MINADEGTILKMFHAVHGDLGRCQAGIIYNGDGDIIAVGCMKNGHEAWRATLSELCFDIVAMQWSEAHD